MIPTPALVAVAAALAGSAALAVPAPASLGTAATPAAARAVPPAVVARPAAGPTARAATGTARAARSAPAFRWPLSPAPAVLRRFAVGPHPWSPGHRGVDLAAHADATVLAAGAGVVGFAGPVAGRGVVTVLHPGGVRTTYEPLTPRVHAGDRVDAGAVIGALATGGHCAGPCLHWGALRGDVYVDPLTLLRPPAPPVLLPLG